MKLALIPPNDLLDYTYKTDYQLMLPQCLKDERYRFVYEKHCSDPDTFIILDNGAAEDFVVDWERYVGTAVKYRPNEIVIPDVLGDYAKTIDQAKHWASAIGGRLMQETFGIQQQFVAQGNSLEEFKASILWAGGQDFIDTIAIPRHSISTCGRLDARSALAYYTLAYTEKDIHFLGYNSHNPRELAVLGKAFEGVDRVRGMDTSAPFVFAYWDQKMLTSKAAVQRPNNYFDQSLAQFATEHLDHNVETMLRWAKGE